MAMSKELKHVVDAVWRNRMILMRRALETGRRKGETHMVKGNPAVEDIYNYISGAVQGQAVGDTQMREFEATLRRKLVGNYSMFKTRGGEPYFWLQTGEKGKNLGQLNRFPEPAQWIGRFIHVIKQKDVDVAERVYVNLTERTRANAFGAIVRKVWHLSGVHSAKVAAPGAEKVDTVVIYCKNVSTRNSVIKILVKYQKKNQQHFESKLPSLVATAGLGIGHGAEPPGISPRRPDSQSFEGVASSTQSFSYYRATLIFIALERTQFPEEMPLPDPSRVAIDLRGHARANRRYGMEVDIGAMQRAPIAAAHMDQKKEFERRVEELFRLAGVDPAHPELQKKEQLTAYITPDTVMAPPTTRAPQ